MAVLHETDYSLLELYADRVLFSPSGATGGLPDAE